MVDKVNKKDETNIRCSLEFLQIIKDYQDRFYSRHNVKASIPEITTIIATKIKKVGGLIV